MKKIILAILLLTAGMQMNAQTPIIWNIDGNHTKIGFTVTHMMINEVDGVFKEFTGSLISTKDDFSDSKVDFTAKTNSITTNNDFRDKHLKSDDFFNAEKFPEIKFISKSFKKIGDKSYKVTGDFTIRDVTKSVTFDVAFIGTVKDNQGNIAAGFKLTGKVNRKDYGVSWSKMLDAGGAVVSDDVQIVCNIELKRQK